MRPRSGVRGQSKRESGTQDAAPQHHSSPNLLQNTHFGGACNAVRGMAPLLELHERLVEPPVVVYFFGLQHWGSISPTCQAEMLKLVAENLLTPARCGVQRWRWRIGCSLPASYLSQRQCKCLPVAFLTLSSFTTAAICKNRRSPPSIVFREQAALRANRGRRALVSCRHQKSSRSFPMIQRGARPRPLQVAPVPRIAILHEAFRPP